MWHYITPSKQQLFAVMRSIEKMIADFCTSPLELSPLNEKNYFYERTGKYCWERDGIYYRVDVIFKLWKPFLTVAYAENAEAAKKHQFQNSKPFPYDLNDAECMQQVRLAMHVPETEAPMAPTQRFINKCIEKEEKEYEQTKQHPRKWNAPLHLVYAETTEEEQASLRYRLTMLCRMGYIKLKDLYRIRSQVPDTAQDMIRDADYRESMTDWVYDRENHIIFLRQRQQYDTNAWRPIDSLEKRYTLLIGDGEELELKMDYRETRYPLERIPLWFCNQTGFLRESIQEVINAAIAAYEGNKEVHSIQTNLGAADSEQLDTQRKQDPLTETKMGAEKILRILVHLLKNKDNCLDCKDLLFYAGGLAGYAAQRSIWETYGTQQNHTQNEVCWLITAKNGKRYYYDNGMIHQYLFTDPYSIWITASRTLQELHPQKKELTGDTLAVIAKRIIDNTNMFVGNDHYRLNEQIELTDSNLSDLHDIWKNIKPLISQHCATPKEWPLLFSMVVRRALQFSDQAAPPEYALRLIMESAICIAKLDLSTE